MRDDDAKGLQLDMKDASILTHLVKFGSASSAKERNLVRMLGADGKRVAQAILGKKIKFSDDVLSTANGLKSWASQPRRSRTTQRRRTKIRKAEAASDRAS